MGGQYEQVKGGAVRCLRCDVALGALGAMEALDALREMVVGERGIGQVGLHWV